MGFLSDLVDAFTSKTDTLKFYKAGVCLPDNTIVPWTDVKNITYFDELYDGEDSPVFPDMLRLLSLS